MEGTGKRVDSSNAGRYIVWCVDSAYHRCVWRTYTARCHLTIQKYSPIGFLFLYLFVLWKRTRRVHITFDQCRRAQLCAGQSRMGEHENNRFVISTGSLGGLAQLWTINFVKHFIQCRELPPSIRRRRAIIVWRITSTWVGTTSIKQIARYEIW